MFGAWVRAEFGKISDGGVGVRRVLRVGAGKIFRSRCWYHCPFRAEVGKLHTDNILHHLGNLRRDQTYKKYKENTGTMSLDILDDKEEKWFLSALE